MYQIWDISSCSVVDEWWRAQLLLLATLGTAMNEMNVNLLLFLERTLFKDQIQVVFLLHRVIFFPGCLFGGCWLEWLLLPPPTRGGVASAGDATLIHITHTQYMIHKHTQELLHNTHMYTWYIWLQIQIYEHMHCMHICSMFNCSSIPQIHSGDWCFPDSQCNATEILKATLGGEPATLCCCVADRLKQTLRYLAH